MSKYTKFLISYGTRYINNKLHVGVEPIQHMLIQEPKHGIFYFDSHNQMFFQCTKDLPDAPTQHLFNLHLEAMRHKELETRYRVLISFELSKCLTNLHLDDFNWLKPKILIEVENFSNDDLDYFVKDQF